MSIRRLLVLGVAANILAVILAIGGAYALGLHAIHQSDRQWCGILSLTIARHPGPHATVTQRRAYAELARLHRQFCN